LQNLSGYYGQNGQTYNGQPIFAHMNGAVKMFYDSDANQWLVANDIGENAILVYGKG